MEFGYTSRGNSFYKSQHDIVNENLISLVAEANRIIESSNFLRNVTTLWVFLQTLFGSFLMCLPDSYGPKWVSIFSKVMFLYAYGENEDPIKYIQIIIQAFTAFFTFTIITDFTINHKFRKWELYILRIWHCHIYNIFIIPNFVSTLNSIATYGIEPNLFNCFALIFNILFSVYCYFHIFRITVPLEQNPFLVRYDIPYWRPNLIYQNYIIYSLQFGLCTFNRLYTNYSRFLPQGVFILSLAYHFYHFADFPYGKLYLNVFHHTFTFAGVYSSILSIVYDIFEYRNDYFFFIPVICLTIISGIFVYIHHNIKTKYFRDSLTGVIGDQSILPESKRSEYFDSLNMSEQDAFYYLQVGISNASPLFLDWSLSNYILEKFSENCEIIVFLTYLVSFFPSETHILHSFITLGLRMSNPSYYLRCFFYQLHRVHVFRQSSASSESTSDFSKVKRLTKTCAGLISWFWLMEATDPSQINNDTTRIITDKIIEADTVWAELLEKYPNNSTFAALYSQYLLDAKSSFKSAAKWHEKAILLENGSLLHNDKLFRGFLQMYPFYLKDKIVDTHGMILRSNRATKVNKNYRTAMSTNSLSSSNSSSNNNSIDFEEAISFIPNLKLRLALEKPVKEVHSVVTQKISIWSIVRLAANILFIFLIYENILSLFDPVQLLSSHLQNLNNFTHPISLLSHELAWFYISSFPDISNETSMMSIYEQIFGESSAKMTYSLNVTDSMNNIIYNLSKDSLYNFDAFSKYLYITNDNDNDIIMEMSNILSQTKMDNIICKNNMTVQKVEKANSTTLSFMLASYLTKSIQLAYDSVEARQNWGNQSSFCEAFMQPWSISTGLNTMINFLMTAVPTIFNPESTDVQTCEFILAFIPFMSLLIIFPNIVFMTFSIEDEKKQLSHMFSTVEEEYAQEASVNISKSGKNDSQRVSAFHYSQRFLNWNLIIDVIAILITCGFMLFNAGFAYNRQSKFSILFQHYLLTFTQRNAIFSLARDSAYLVLNKQLESTGLRTRFLIEDDIFDDVYEIWSTIYELPFTNGNEVNKYLLKDIIELQQISNLVVEGSGNIPPIIGYNQEITNFRETKKCDVDERSTSPLTYASCVSFDRLIAYFTSVVKEVFIHGNELTLNSSTMLQLPNLIESRLSLEFDQLMTMYNEILDDHMSEIHNISIALIVIELVLTVSIFFVEFELVFSMKREMFVWKSLLLRLNPLGVVSNPVLLSWIFGSEIGIDKKIRTPAQSIFQTSNDSMIFLSSDQIIETVNPASTLLFGYTNEQMIGQDIRLLLNQDDNSKLYYVMKMMNSGQSEMVFEDNVIGTKDDSSNVRMKAELIGFAGDDKRAKSFIILFKDMTDEIQQNEAIDEARKQTDVIMHQILPKNIIARIKSDSQELSFSVATATVIAINIDNFTSYAASLTPSDVLKNLGKVITAFNKLVDSSPLITVVKSIGDAYLAIGGLFEKDVDPKIHANQVLQFASNSLIAIDELNIALNANLQIRIGITTDGPIIVGVLDKDKPVFDVYGVPINNAIQLEKTGVPGQMHIPQSTYDLVNDSKFQIEEKGTMNLKGRGEVKTYIVYQDENADTSKVTFIIDNENADNQFKFNVNHLDNPPGEGFTFRISSLLE